MEPLSGRLTLTRPVDECVAHRGEADRSGDGGQARNRRRIGYCAVAILGHDVVVVDFVGRGGAIDEEWLLRSPNFLERRRHPHNRIEDWEPSLAGGRKIGAVDVETG